MGINGNSVATDNNDNDNNNARKRESTLQFLEGCPTLTLRGAFWEDDTNDNDDRDK